MVTQCGLYHLSTVADNELDAEGMAALAPALSKLVSLTSLDLGGTYAVFCDRVAHGRRVRGGIVQCRYAGVAT